MMMMKEKDGGNMVVTQIPISGIMMTMTMNIMTTLIPNPVVVGEEEVLDLDSVSAEEVGGVRRLCSVPEEEGVEVVVVVEGVVVEGVGEKTNSINFCLKRY